MNKLMDFLFSPVDWRNELQQDIDTNNALRACSLRRVGDSLTETKKLFVVAKEEV